MRVIILILLVIMNACGAEFDPTKPDVYSVDPELEPYVQEFRDQASERGRHLKITNLVAIFNEDLEGNVVGLCTHYSTPLVQIDRGYWDRVSNQKRSMLVAHELGHCILKLGHDTSDTLAIMRPTTLKEDDIFSYFVDLWDGIFSTESQREVRYGFTES